ncbi:hypothetical protein NST99_19025 [Paenibacillus sp. FSL L8-0470]|uniref:hypothetical protein n=1 Tax=unclassified Paenibacillus TaxID=185978 RepID=UPI0030FA6D34
MFWFAEEVDVEFSVTLVKSFPGNKQSYNRKNTRNKNARVRLSQLLTYSARLLAGA